MAPYPFAPGAEQVEEPRAHTTGAPRPLAAIKAVQNVAAAGVHPPRGHLNRIFNVIPLMLPSSFPFRIV